ERECRVRTKNLRVVQTGGLSHEHTLRLGVIPAPVSPPPPPPSRIAAAKISDLYRRTGGSLGPLGVPVGPLVQEGQGFRQNYLLGSIHLNDVNDIPVAEEFRDVEVKIAAVKCFGTEDPSGTDETYLVISLVSLNPNFRGV